MKIKKRQQMKPKKIILLIAVLILSLGSFGQENTAQEISPKAKELAKKSDEIMKSSLNLTTEQSEAVSDINLEFSQKMVTLFEKPGSKFSKIGDMRAYGKERNADLKEVLTAEQMKLFEKKVEGKVRKEMKKIMNKDS